MSCLQIRRILVLNHLRMSLSVNYILSFNAQIPRTTPQDFRMSLSANYILSFIVKLISTHGKILIVDITINDMIPLVSKFLHVLFGLGRVNLKHNLIWPLQRECNLLHFKQHKSIKRIIEVILQTVGNNYIIKF